MAFSNLRTYISHLRKEKEIVDVFHEVDPSLEIAEIHRRVIAAEGPALFFHNVKGYSFPIVTNLFGTKKRVEKAFGPRPEAFLKELTQLAHEKFPPSLSTLWKKRHLLRDLVKIGTKRVSKAPLKECAIHDLCQLPLLKSWPQDGGDFITLPLVYTEPPGGGSSNLGMYRIQRYSSDTTGLHFQIQKGGGFHYSLAEAKNQPLPVSIFIGGPPALILSAIAPLPENMPELLMASLLLGSKVPLTSSPLNHYPLLAECEFALLGEALPAVRHPEGPFGDHYGYYSLQHDFPLFHCKKIFHRKGAIYPATVVGKPKQEDYYIGDYLQELLSPLFPLVMPSIKALWSYGETGFHSLSAAIVKERYYRECMSAAFRILGEGQLSLTKFLLVTDQQVDLKDFKSVLTTILERMHPETDLFIFSNLSLDTLDYTGPELNKGSRGIMLGLGEKVRDLPQTFHALLPSPLRKAKVYSPGCLVIEAPSYLEFQDFASLLDNTSLQSFPLIILVDNLQRATDSNLSFLWTVFTRFEPAADIHAKSKLLRHHLCYSFPILIDARMKPSYPPETLCDPITATKVTQSWHHYFPQGMEMGSSDHL